MSAKSVATDWLEGLTRPSHLKESDFVYPDDSRRLAMLRSAPLFPVRVLTKFILDLLTKAARGEVLGTSVKVSEHQHVAVFRVAQKASGILQMDVPEVFVLETPGIGAFSMGTDESNAMVLLTRELVERFGPRQLMFVLGHEFSHIKCGHLFYQTLVEWLTGGLVEVAGAVPFGRQVMNVIGQAGLLAWSRRAEITCDRGGLVCCQDLTAAKTALARAMGAAGAPLEEVALRDIEDQLKGVGWIERWSEVFSPHPWLPRRLKALSVWSLTLFYRRTIKGAKGSFMVKRNADRVVGEILQGREPDHVEMRSGLHDDATVKGLFAAAVVGGYGEPSEDEFKRFATLVEPLQLSSKKREWLHATAKRGFAPSDLPDELTCFEGDRGIGLPYAFSAALGQEEQAGFWNKLLLGEILELVGVEQREAQQLTADPAFRTKYFSERFGETLCKECHRVISARSKVCRGCGAKQRNT